MRTCGHSAAGVSIATPALAPAILIPPLLDPGKSRPLYCAPLYAFKTPPFGPVIARLTSLPYQGPVFHCLSTFLFVYITLFIVRPSLSALPHPFATAAPPDIVVMRRPSTYYSSSLFAYCYISACFPPGFVSSMSLCLASSRVVLSSCRHSHLIFTVHSLQSAWFLFVSPHVSVPSYSYC